MSDTPRTEIRVVVHAVKGLRQNFVHADFARTLERENARLREALTDLVERCIDVTKGRSFSDARKRADLEEPLKKARDLLADLEVKP